MVKKVGNKWVVSSKSGKYLGTYSTKKEANTRLKQIEYFKRLKDMAGVKQEK